MNKRLVLKISLCAVAAALFLSVVRGAEFLLIAAAAAALHEAGHIAAAKALGVPCVRMSGAFFGLSIRCDFSSVSFLKEALVCSAGAAANVAACALTLLIVKDPGTYSVFFIFSNVSLALFNLMPISPLDGAGILKALLSMIASYRTAERIASWISAAFSVAFFCFCVYVQLKIGANLSLLFISVYLLYNAAGNIRAASYEKEP